MWFEDEESDELRVMVATTAYGTGVNNPYCNGFIGWGCQRTVRDTIQTTGRPGRAGQPAIVMLVIHTNDIKVMEPNLQVMLGVEKSVVVPVVDSGDDTITKICCSTCGHWTSFPGGVPERLANRVDERDEEFVCSDHNNGKCVGRVNLPECLPLNMLGWQLSSTSAELRSSDKYPGKCGANDTGSCDFCREPVLPVPFEKGQFVKITTALHYGETGEFVELTPEKAKVNLGGGLFVTVAVTSIIRAEPVTLMAAPSPPTHSQKPKILEASLLAKRVELADESELPESRILTSKGIALLKAWRPITEAELDSLSMLVNIESIWRAPILQVIINHQNSAVKKPRAQSRPSGSAAAGRAAPISVEPSRRSERSVSQNEDVAAFIASCNQPDDSPSPRDTGNRKKGNQRPQTQATTPISKNKKKK
jgi:hypothetical protein